MEFEDRLSFSCYEPELPDGWTNSLEHITEQTLEHIHMNTFYGLPIARTYVEPSYDSPWEIVELEPTEQMCKELEEW